MTRRYAAFIALVSLLVPLAAAADSIDRDLSGVTPAGQAVSFHVHVDFTPTGGNFSAGTGTATVAFTLRNTSGLYPFQQHTLGNPILTAFYFDVPAGGVVSYTEARVLAGSTEFDPGDFGPVAPLSCTQLAADDIRTSWYQLETSNGSGGFGIFTNDLGTANGLSEGLVDPSVIAACVKQGDVVAQSAVAGQVRFTCQLSHLTTALQSAGDFSNLCSTARGDATASSFAGHFQGCDNNGQGSTYVGDTPCPTPTRATTWGALKAIYR